MLQTNHLVKSISATAATFSFSFYLSHRIYVPVREEKDLSSTKIDFTIFVTIDTFYEKLSICKSFFVNLRSLSSRIVTSTCVLQSI